jgi:hypothetical protein
VSQEAQILACEREALNKVLILDLNRPEQPLLGANQQVIENWWRAYKNWEAKDDFNTAFQDHRMCVRTFEEGVGVPAQFSEDDKALQSNFLKQKNFAFKNLDALQEQFWKDSQYLTSLRVDEQQIISVKNNTAFYHAKRGIDTSAFANPANFATRLDKYKAGVHDLSVSLLKRKEEGLLTQVFHKKEKGTHWTFVALSQEADQEVLFNLIRLAKLNKQKTSNLVLYGLIRTYRAEMTRVKLAHDQDMGVGFTYMPLPEPIVTHIGKNPIFDPPKTVAFKTHYSLAKTHKDRDTAPNGGIKTTNEYFLARQRSARQFKTILETTTLQNEMVIALRKHAGPFPVNAMRWDDELLCYDIVGNKFKLNGKKISKLGVMSG